MTTATTKLTPAQARALELIQSGEPCDEQGRFIWFRDYANNTTVKTSTLRALETKGFIKQVGTYQSHKTTYGRLAIKTKTYNDPMFVLA